MVEIQSLEQLREIQAKASKKSDTSVKIGRNLAKTLQGLEHINVLEEEGGINLPGIEKAIGPQKIIDLLYLAGIYWINEAASDKEERATVAWKEQHENSVFWDAIRNHFTALWYTEADKHTFFYRMMTYVWSSEQRGRLKVMPPAELNNEILRVQTPLGYRTKMEWIYQRSFGAFSKVGSNNKDETGHILWVEYPEEFAKTLAACSDEIGKVVATYNDEHMEEEAYIPVRYVPYTSEKMHTTIAVVRKPSSDTKRTRKDKEQWITLDEEDTILEKAPTFEVQGIGSSADTVVVKTLPKDGRQLGLVQKTVLEWKTDSSETIWSWPLSHITVGRFVTDAENNTENIGKAAVRVISDDLVNRVQEVMDKYTEILKKEYLTVSPTAVFSGDFDLNTVWTATPQFALNKNKVVSFKDAQ